MSEGHAAPAPAAKAPAAQPVDPVEELAKQVFIQLSANLWATAGEAVMAAGKALVDHELSSAKAFVAGLRAGLRGPAEPFPRLPAGPATLSPFRGFRRRLTRRFKLGAQPSTITG